jgi:hypothetical protein
MKPKNKKQQAQFHTLFEKWDSFLERHDRVWFWTLFGITLLVSILLYDQRISTGGDDSSYIISARDFLEEFKFPSFQGPLYPIFLSLIYGLFGMSLPTFKIFSLISMQACLFLLFLTFRRRIPATLLFITLLLTAINSRFLYFASQTYSEAFYMFMQTLAFFVFCRFFIDREPEKKGFLWLSLAVLGVILTRNIGYSLFLCLVGYFAAYRQWKNMIWFTGTCLLCFGVFQLVKYAVWHDPALLAADQGSGLLNKNFYYPSYGREDLNGFLNRFWVNSRNYFSQFFMMLGLRERNNPDGSFTPSHPVYVILMYLIGLTSIYFSFKRNRYLFFTAIVTTGFLVVTFFILQTSWNQYRLIVPVFPFMILLAGYAVYSLLSLPKFRAYQFLLVILFLPFFMNTLSDTRQAIKTTSRIKSKYSGLTPDWVHYIQASEWAADSLPPDALVACRKPSISSIYGKGKQFYGIYRIPSGHFDSFYKRWRSDSLAFSLICIKGFTNPIVRSLRGHCEAQIILDKKGFLVLKDSAAVKMAREWPKLEVITSPTELSPFIKEANDKVSIYYADSLLVPLLENGVTHVLFASLRTREEVKSGVTISTVERYVAYIQWKYPGFIEPLRQFGRNNDEPAVIFRINRDTVSHN